MSKDLTGNKQSIFTCLGARNFAQHEREINDYYATEPKAVELLLEQEKFNKHILEPACGEGHISNVLAAHGYNVRSSDIIARGYGEVQDFFEIENWGGDVITNPPYKFAQHFVEHALNITDANAKIAMFLRIQFLEGKARRKLFDACPPKTIYVASSRLQCALNGDFEGFKGSSAACYAWFVWEKGYSGDAVVKWIN